MQQVKLDFNTPESIADSLKEVDKLFVLTPTHPKMVDFTTNLISAAKDQIEQPPVFGYCDRFSRYKDQMNLSYFLCEFQLCFNTRDYLTERNPVYHKFEIRYNEGMFQDRT